MSDSISDEDVERIRAAIFAGRKIEAIKLYRECTGKGLKEAKDFVEALEAELRRLAPDQFTAPPAGKGCAVIVVGIIVFIVVLIPALAIAAPPTITTISPHGLERGKTVTLVINGTNLTNLTRLQLPFAAKQELIEDPKAKPNPAQVKLAVTVDSTVTTGIYPVRVVTQDGLSALTFLAVDSLPSGVEMEDNNTPEKAQAFSIPIIINGTCAGGDVDFYRFSAKKGQRLVIETETGILGSAVVPQIRLTDARQRFIAADDTQGHRGDGRIVFDVAAEGDYLLEFSDSRYRGGNPAHYRIKIGDYDIADELFPLGGRRGDNATFTLRGGTLGKELSFQRALSDAGSSMPLNLDGLPLKPGMLAPSVAIGDYPEKIWEKGSGNDPRRLDIVAPITVNGRIEAKGDIDRFQLPVSPGQKYRFSVQAYLLGSRLDGVLRIADASGKQIALIDDVNVAALAPGQQPFNNPDPSVDVTVPDGVNLLVAELRDQRRRGGLNFTYRLTVEPIVPDFELRIVNAEINVPKSGNAVVTVNVTRRGYTGPIQLKVPDLPAGYSLQGGIIPANGTTGLLTISASQDVKIGASSFTVEGTGENLKRTAQNLISVGKDQSTAPVIVQILSKIAVAPTSAQPFAVQGPTSLDVVKGYPTAIPVKLTRSKDAEKLAIEVSGTTPSTPNVLTYQPASIAADKNDGVLNITIPVAATEGQSSFAVQGRATVNNVAAISVGPAFTINVLRPFVIEGPATLALTPGQTVPLKFTFKRNGPFKEAINVNLTGLPQGVTLAEPPKPVPADKSELVVQLKVDPKVAVPTAALTLNATAAITGMTFTHPPLTVNASIKK